MSDRLVDGRNDGRATDNKSNLINQLNLLNKVESTES